ncbi:hypothetical protein Vau01_017200 [Virgisporangium aurantiacum]|uniref:Uncharacterized protein n=1 Tax=Virgisporangium aurantiacum TaxID=175570 RepID=A0A8J4DXS2_9ACTN|nr:hypothetical protein Vau01_017200 [Virgisporangium aurantiacum]
MRVSLTSHPNAFQLLNPIGGVGASVPGRLGTTVGGVAPAGVAGTAVAAFPDNMIVQAKAATAVARRMFR